MNLIHALAPSPLSWTLEVAETLSPRNNKMSVMRMTVTPAPDVPPIARDFPLSSTLTPEAMLALLMKEHLPHDPMLRQWLDSKGNVSVALEAGILDSVSEAMHTALRKLAGSKQSSITWNALQHLHPSDWTALWDAVRQVLTEAYAPGKPVSRRQLAILLRDKVIATTDARRAMREVPDEDGEMGARKKLQGFSLTMLHLGCELTELDEWMWGWLGYVVKDEVMPVASPAMPPAVTG
jgi:hypothetical protein